MSSHHFVKEGQEPAVFITEPLSLELIEPLLEWAPLVMITDTVLDDAIRWGFKIDVVITHTITQQIVAEKMAAQIPFKIISYQDEENSVIKGLNYLLKQNQQAVHVIN
ncbi:MAG TPA: thiamine pyrophosphokinase, partial [Cyclobacteriaceae bacterium]